MADAPSSGGRALDGLASWKVLGHPDFTYRAVPVYNDMLWGTGSVSVSKSYVVAAPFAGPIAVYSEGSGSSSGAAPGAGPRRGSADATPFGPAARPGFGGPSSLNSSLVGGSTGPEIRIYSAAGAALGTAHPQLAAEPSSAASDAPSLAAFADAGSTASSHKLVFMGWSAREHLFAVFENGAVEAFTPRGERLQGLCTRLWGGSASSSSSGSASLPYARREAVELAAMSPGGRCLAVVSRGAADGLYTLYVMPELAPSREGGDSSRGGRAAGSLPVLVRDTGLKPGQRPAAIAVLDGGLASSSSPPPQLGAPLGAGMEVLVASPARSLLAIDVGATAAALADGSLDPDAPPPHLSGSASSSPALADAVTDLALEPLLSTGVMRLAVSPGGRYVAAFDQAGSLLVFGASFEKKLLHFETKAAFPPSDMAWCGEDSVVLTWPGRASALMVGPFGDWAAFALGGGGGTRAAAKRALAGSAADGLGLGLGGARDGGEDAGGASRPPLGGGGGGGDEEEEDDDEEGGLASGVLVSGVDAGGDEDDPLAALGLGGDASSVEALYTGGWPGAGCPLALAPELDGLRVVTSSRAWLLHRIDPKLVGLRDITSSDPGAVLLDASQRFSERGDAVCDEIVRGLASDDLLLRACLDCIRGAVLEWEPEDQRGLLRAAAYGKSFDRVNDAARAAPAQLDAVIKLRLLNTLRGVDAGLPLSAPQLEALGASALVDRLCARHAHKLALAVCDALIPYTSAAATPSTAAAAATLGPSSSASGATIPSPCLALPADARDRVLVHWASAKVKASPHLSDDALIAALRRRLGGVAAVSYADIAATADSAGRRKLATRLLDCEPRAADQVPILLKMREGKLALEKALRTGDASLVHLVLLHLQRAAAGGSKAAARHSAFAVTPLPPAVVATVLAYPGALSLLASHLATITPAGSPPDVLLQLLLAGGRYVDAGLAVLRFASSDVDADGEHRRRPLGERVKLLKRAIEIFAEGEKERGGSDGSGGGKGGGATAAGGGAPGGASAAPLGGGNLAAAAPAAAGPALGMTPAALAALQAAERAECAFYRAATEDALALAAAQADATKEVAAASRAGNAWVAEAVEAGLVPEDFLGLSAKATLTALATARDGKRLAGLADALKLPDALVWHARIDGAAAGRDWAGLWTLATSKKSPVGYRPFADAALAAGAPGEARKYALTGKLITEYGERLAVLEAAGAWGDAAELAAKARDGEALQRLAGRPGLPPAAAEIVERALAGL